MRMTVKSISMTFFKGCYPDTTTIFFDDGDNIISGRNASGKTTIADAWFWLWADKNYLLASNPAIAPVGVEECTPTVTAMLDIDGTEVSVTKKQKRTVKERNGVKTVALSNTYEVNTVPCGERDFKKKMEAYGVDPDTFLALSHLNVFTGQKETEQRKVLFGMCDAITDKEIASRDEATDGLCELLDKYTLEEIKSMQNASLRKIREVYGKNGELLRAKIEGLALSKAVVESDDVLSKKEADAKERIVRFSKDLEKVRADMHTAVVMAADIDRLNEDIRKAREQQKYEAGKAHREWEMQMSEVANLLANKQLDARRYAMDLEQQEERLTKCETELKHTNDDIATIDSASFNESTICPYCGRELPDDKVEEIIREWNANQKDGIVNLTKRKESLNTLLERIKGAISRCKASLEEAQSAVAEYEKQRAELNWKEPSVDTASIEDGEAVLELIKRHDETIEKRTALVATIDRDFVSELQTKLDEANAELNDIRRKQVLCKNNAETDAKIASLKKGQTAYEQGIADAERILYMISVLERNKNELLQESINKHFRLVKFRLFDYQKNGEYKNVCVPTVDGKDLNTGMNNALILRAKKDIAEGLQRFYGKHYPLFVDNAECLDSKNIQAFLEDSDTQNILTVVSNTDMQIQPI